MVQTFPENGGRLARRSWHDGRGRRSWGRTEQEGCQLGK